MMDKLTPFRSARALGFVVLALAPACLSRPLEPIDPQPTVSITETLAQSRIDKIDILLAIDNSGSMADKQEILAQAVPRLVEALLNPPCLGDNDEVVSTPASPLDPCPAGSRREFEPVLDIHIGVLSSSLGDRGGKTCIPSETSGMVDDAGHLIHRIDPLDADGGLPTFEGKGFLVWRPEEPGTQAGLYQDLAQLSTDMEAIVRGVGENGCGHEAQLESWYRFLVEPDPYLDVQATVDENGYQGPSELVGTDEELLQQRRDFVRPDSLLAVLMLTDENDCSFRANGYGWVTGDISALKRLKARAECADDIHDPCCAPCDQPPSGCPADPTCDDPVPADHGSSNLACFDQKRRYGVDLLYPVQRYVDGLTQPEVTDRHGQLVANPLFVSESGIPRGRDRLFLAGIVGVPWQLIARDPADLEQGFQDAAELEKNGTWSTILGDPANDVPPSDPHMLESSGPRPGLPGTDAGPTADPIHGHEYQPLFDNGWGDLQYACTFELPTPITCDSSYGNCDCSPARSTNNPLCQASDGGYSTTTQYRAKGYPSRRQLAVMRGIGDQAIVGSICPAQMQDPTAKDYGYLPAIEALIERLKSRLRGLCLSRQLEADPSGQVSCLVLEGKKLGAGESCDCNAAGRSPVRPENQPAISDALEQPVARAAGLDCFCAIDQLEGDELAVCQQSTDAVPTLGPQPIDGWCYIDAGSFPPIGNAELVEHCRQSGQLRTIRFVGAGEPASNTMTFISCQQ